MKKPIKENNDLPHLSGKVVSGIKGFKLDAYLIALEGWRRGLTLKWYKDETDLCTLDKVGSSTQGKFFSLEFGDKIHYFFRSRGDKVANKAVRICHDKEKTKDFLSKKNVPIPLGRTFKINDKKEMIEYAKKIKFPVVIKPVNGSMGRGVFTDIQNETELQEILSNLTTTLKYSDYMIEKYYTGQEYRVYVVGDKVVGAMNRLPANILADGIHTIKELIHLKNMTRKKNPYLQRKPIKVDYEIKQTLENLGYKLDTIPKKNETVYLRNISNLSAGGDSISATQELSDEVKKVAVNALKALPSIPQGGVDIIVDSIDNKKCVVLEINATAEISFHPFPLIGEPQDIPAAIIDYYFPETIGKKKSSFYFDFQSILEPLKSWSTNLIEVPQPFQGGIFGKRYIAEGKVIKVGYMSRIRRQALKRNLYGFSKQVGNNKIEITLFGTDKNVLNDFYDVCKKGSKKSVVKKLKEEDIILNHNIKMGFEIISKKKKK